MTLNFLLKSKYSQISISPKKTSKTMKINTCKTQDYSMNDKRTTPFSELLRKPITEVNGYFEYVKALYEEWRASDGKIYPTFETLHHCFTNLNSKLPPQFFTGDINAKVVMISLNSHAGDDKPGAEIDASPFCQTWEKYLHFWTNFAYERYAP